MERYVVWSGHVKGVQVCDTYSTESYSSLQTPIACVASGNTITQVHKGVKCAISLWATMEYYKEQGDICNLEQKDYCMRSEKACLIIVVNGRMWMAHSFNCWRTSMTIALNNICRSTVVSH